MFKNQWPPNPAPHSCQIHNLADLLDEHIGFKTDGRFVEAGGFDGQNYSNTYQLAELGWRGLVIEPNKEAYEANKALRKKRGHKVTVLNYAVSDYNGTATLYVGSTLSTISKNMRDVYNTIAWAGTSGLSNGVEQQCKVATLDKLLRKTRWWKEFDLLSLDVEGSELAALMGFPIGFWAPTMCLIETHAMAEEPELKAMAAGVHEYMDFWGYRLVSEDGINSVYVKGR